MDKWRIKKGDLAQVITGKSKGLKGEILSVDRQNRRVVVKGVNVVAKHQKPSMTDPGGIVSSERSIHASNVMLVDPSDDRPARIGMKMVDGKKVRYSKRNGNVI